MNCTRVLHVVNPRRGGPSPIMPVDMAVRICLAGSPPLRSFLSNYDTHCSASAAALRPCLSGSVAAAAAEVSDGAVRPRRKKKKNVAFADSQGFALTTVHVFDEAEDDLLTELQFFLSELDATAVPHLDGNKDPEDCGSALVLDFTQPASDYLDLRNRLKAQKVCLETCSVQEHQLSGTVQVRNLCYNKSVSVRITFDSWRSFKDVQCRYLNNIYSCPDNDTFSFSVSVPELLEPSDRVEFCLQYQAEDETFWDNNHGKNYALVLADPKSSPAQSSDSTAGREIHRHHVEEKREGMELDPFGSPRTSAGIFPEWQSWGHIEASTPYW